MSGGHKIILDANPCPRCGLKHPRMSFDPIKKAPEGGPTHQADCPMTEKQIMYASANKSLS